MKALVTLLLMTGCAAAPSVPFCENPRYQLAEEEQGQPLAVFDMAEIEKLIRTITGLSKGTCRLAVEGGKDS